MQPAIGKDRGTVDMDSKQRLRLWIRLLRTTRYLEGELRERLRREMDTTLPRFDVMAALNRAALDRADTPMTMTELSRYLMVSNGNVTGIIDRLVQDGLVTRSQKERDRRTSVVVLTEAGEAAFSRMAEAHEGWVDELLSSIEIEDAADMIDILTRFDRAQRGQAT
ncbi:MAG: MarR family winged helix-turn-helix transcriptional regulator [Geminicoccaceae bacterium]